MIMIVLGVVLILFLGLIYHIVSGYDYNSLKPRLVQEVQERTGRELIIHGDISFAPGLSPILQVEDVSLSNAGWSQEPFMVQVRRFELQVSLWSLLRREVNVRRLILDQPHFILETDSQGRSNLDLTPVEADASKDGSIPETGQDLVFPGITTTHVLFRDARLEIRNHGLDSRWIFQVDQFETRSSSRDFQDIYLEMSINGLPVKARGTCGSLTAILDPEVSWMADLKVMAAETEFVVQGRLQDVLELTGVELEIMAQARDISHLSGFFEAVSFLSGPFSLTASLVSSQKNVLDVSGLDVSLGQSHMQGRFAVDLNTDRPSVQAVFHSRTLDMSPFMTHRQGAAGQSGQKLFSPAPLPVDILKKIDLDLDLRVEELVLPSLVLADFEMIASLDNGSLNISEAKAVSGPGIMTAGFTFNAGSQLPDIHLNARLSGWDLASTFEALDHDFFQEALVDADIDLYGHGRSVAEIMAGLNGRVQAGLGPSVLKNSSIEGLGADLRANLFRLFNPAEDRGSVTVINCGVLLIESRQGLAEVEALILDTARMTVRGRGSIDLRDETLDIGLQPRPKEGLDTGLFGKWSLSLSELARALRVSGTLAQPRLAVDPGRSLVTFGRGVAGTVLLGPIGAAASLLGSTDAGEACIQILERQSPEPETDREGIGGTLDSMGESLRRFFR